MKLGNIIAQLRTQKGLNQRKLAQELGVSNGAVAMWETNKRQPDLDMIKKISAFFDVPVSVLLGTEDFHNQSTDMNNKSKVPSGFFFFFFDESLKDIFVSQLQKALSNKELSETDFYNLISFDVEKCKSYFKGECEPSLEDLKEISQILDVSVDFLLGNPKKEQVSAEEETILLYYNQFPTEIMKLLNSFCSLSEKDRTKVLGKCFDLEDLSSSVAADELLKKTGTTNSSK